MPPALEGDLGMWVPAEPGHPGAGAPRRGDKKRVGDSESSTLFLPSVTMCRFTQGMPHRSASYSLSR